MTDRLRNKINALASQGAKARPLQRVSHAMLRPLHRTRRSAFTLMELMVVVGIISVVAAAAAPTIGRSRAEARTNEVANNIVRLLRHARSAAAGYGRAHLAIFNPADDGGDGSIEVFRGINNRCNANPWPALTAGGCDGSEMCMDSVEGAGEALGNSRFRTSMPDFPGGAQICFEPTGITRWRRNIATNFTAENADVGGSLQGGFRFSIQRHNPSGDVGVVRRVVLPLGSDARVQR